MELPDGSVRKLRAAIESPGHAHELTFTCHRRMRMLRHERTRWWMVEAMARARRMHDLDLIAYVIMPDHVHVLFRPRRESYSIAAILKAMKQGVSRRAVAWLRKHSPGELEKLRVAWPDGRVEHRFWKQGGGYDRNIHGVRALRNSVRYIHRNPVRAGLVERAGDWEWSSARAYLGFEDVVLRMGPSEEFRHGQARGGLSMPADSRRGS